MAGRASGLQAMDTMGFWEAQGEGVAWKGSWGSQEPSMSGKPPGCGFILPSNMFFNYKSTVTR